LPTSAEAFLEELRAIAQLGRNYTQDPYDRERYERLLELAAVEYGSLARLSSDEALNRFRAELGHITPKVGVDAAIFDADGRLLLIRRTDDDCWCLPCGWAEVGESPQEAIAREVFEEVQLRVHVESLVDLFTRLPGAYGPHTAYFLVFHCVVVGGTPATSSEASEVGWFLPEDVSRWHRDHRERAERARLYWLETLSAR
jgi:ADP-ribose pyrophosphatase YjhB (NUDIX family)